MDILQNNVESLKKEFELRRVHLGKEGKLNVGPIQFSISKYEIDDAGNLVLLKGKMFFGLMKMDTLVITPFYKDAPIYAYDRIYAKDGSDKIFVEMLDTVIFNKSKRYNRKMDEMIAIKKSYGDVFKVKNKKAWYDSLRCKPGFVKECEGRFSAVLDKEAIEMFNAYVSMLKTVHHCDVLTKKKATTEFVDGLLEKGGPSCDHLIKSIGKEKAKNLFYNVIFGIA